VPSDSWPSAVFTRLFLDGRSDEVEAQVRRLRDGRSILDAVGDQVRGMQPKLGGGDQQPFHAKPAGTAGRQRLPARPAPGLQSEQSAAVVESVRFEVRLAWCTLSFLSAVGALGAVGDRSIQTPTS
jgi:hypothetical protein